MPIHLHFSKFKGEISYPGGKFDPRYDKSSIDTALRETEEELGLQSKSFEIWAELPPLPSKDGKTSVTPVVALFKVLRVVHHYP